LTQEVVPTALRAGFLTPCHDQLGTAVMLELFACADDDFMNKFSMAGTIQSLKAQRQQVAVRAERLVNCQKEFEAIALCL
jgi:hypothetical protein